MVRNELERLYAESIGREMGYKFVEEPTEEQFEAYKRVRYYLTQLQVAEFVSGTAPIRLEQDEFDNVVHFAHECDLKRPADGAFIRSLYLSELRSRKPSGGAD